MRHWANNAVAQLVFSIGAGSTTISVNDSSTFPDQVIGGFDFGEGDFFLLTLKSSLTASTPNEIVKVVGSPSSNTYTVERAQEGTSAQSWNVGTVAAGQLTAEAVNAFEQGTGDPSTVVSDSTLDGDGSAGDPLGLNFGSNVFGLGGGAVLLDSGDDINDIRESGWYFWRGLGGTPANAAGTRGRLMHVEGPSISAPALFGSSATQIMFPGDNSLRWRQRDNANWTPFRISLHQVSSNNTLVGQGTPSSPLGVNASVFETQINSDASMFGTGDIGNPLGVHPVIAGQNVVDNAGNQTVDIDGFGFAQPESFITIVNGGGSDFELTLNLGPDQSATHGKKLFLTNNSNSTVTLIAGTGVNWINSPAGDEIDIPPGSGLITMLVVLDVVDDLGLSIQGEVVATP